MLTLVATAPNLVVNAELIRQGAQGFGFFSFTPFGLPLLGLGILYMLFARRLLASKPACRPRRTAAPALREWIEQYRLADREQRVRVSAELAARRESASRNCRCASAGVNLLAIERGTGFAAKVLRPSAQTVLQAGDVLLVDVHTSSGRDHDAAADTQARAAAVRRRRGLLHRPFPGDRHGGGHPAGGIRSWSARRCCRPGCAPNTA